MHAPFLIHPFETEARVAYPSDDEDRAETDIHVVPGRYAYLENYRIAVIDTVIEPGKRYLGRIINSDEQQPVEIQHQEILTKTGT